MNIPPPSVSVTVLPPPIVPGPSVLVAAEIIKSAQRDLTFTFLEVGALPINSEEEPFHRVLRYFPSSRLLAFEVDPVLCEKLNATAAQGVRYHAVPLGRAEETRVFHETRHPMCGSLYAPDERYADAFNGLDVMRLDKTCEVRTASLDKFAADHGVEGVDLIKIDVQGAELEIFQGGANLLRTVSCIVSEVEFVPLYKDQPLFGDVDAFLRGQGFLFHKFLGLSGRTMKPLIVNGDINAAIQHMWSDAVFVRNLLEPAGIRDEQLLKLAVLMELYGSVDVAAYFLDCFDRRQGTDFARMFLHAYTGKA
jgi:FkbM family methyltransferase